MKKISVEVLCDEFYIADSLRELASNIENCDNVYDYIEDDCLEISGDHYVAEIKIVEV